MPYAARPLRPPSRLARRQQARLVQANYFFCNNLYQMVQVTKFFLNDLYQLVRVIKFF